MEEIEIIYEENNKIKLILIYLEKFEKILYLLRKIGGMERYILYKSEEELLMYI